MRLQIAVSDEIAERLTKQAARLGITRSAYCSVKLAEVLQADEMAWKTMDEMSDDMKEVFYQAILEQAKKS